MQTWMARVERSNTLEDDNDFIDTIRTEQKGLFAALHTHKFRPEDKEKERKISPKRFQLASGFLN